MIVMGIDVGTNVGLAKVNTETSAVLGRLVTFPKQRGFERLQLIASEIVRVVEAWTPDAIFIEGYAIYRPNGLITLVEIGTMIRWQLFRLGLNWTEVPPTTLKKWVTGRGNAKKDDMAVAVAGRWGYSTGLSKGDDVIDAVGLAHLGAYVAGRGNESDPAIRGLVLGW